LRVIMDFQWWQITEWSICSEEHSE
jgi:hypothetical protein